MKYPFNVEICAAEFAKTEGSNDKNIKFFREYIALLNDIYNDGLNNPVAYSIEEVFKLETCEAAFKKLFKESYEKFLTQVRDAYKQGQADKANNYSKFLKQAISSIG